MGRPKKLLGYDMGNHIESAMVSIELLREEYNMILELSPIHPREWVKFIGRAGKHIKDARTELQLAHKIYREAKELDE